LPDCASGYDRGFWLRDLDLWAFVFLREESAMRDAKRVSVTLIATIAAAAFGGVGVLAAPTMCFLFLTCGGMPANTAGTLKAEEGVVMFAVIAPVVMAAIGFLGGGVMACLFNVLSHEKPRPQVVVQERSRAASASSLSDVA